MQMRKLFILGTILSILILMSIIYACVTYKNFVVCGLGNNTLKCKIAKEAYKIYEFYTKKLHLKILPPCEKHYYITLTYYTDCGKYGERSGCAIFSDKCLNSIELVPSSGRYAILNRLLPNFKSIVFVLAHELAHAVNHYYNSRVIRVIDESFANAFAEFYLGFTIQKIIENRLLYFDEPMIDFYCVGLSSLKFPYECDYIDRDLCYYRFSLEALYIINTSIRKYIEIVKENNVTLWWYSALPLLAMFVNGSKTITRMMNNIAELNYEIKCGYYVTHNMTLTIDINCLKCARFITAPVGDLLQVSLMMKGDKRMMVKQYRYGKNTIILILSSSVYASHSSLIKVRILVFKEKQKKSERLLERVYRSLLILRVSLLFILHKLLL
ncbi:MAG: hypothetical protein GXO43_03330 [Crenarchaeota archaeon]|nr:hypothetical protein [Thermoproteota archaeon]